MKQPSFAIFSNKTSENTKDLVEAIEALGYTMVIIRMEDVVIHYNPTETIVTHNGTNILNYDIFLFRSYMDHVESARLIANHLLEKKKTVIDETLGRRDLRNIGGKNFQLVQCAHSNIPFPRSIQAHSAANLEKELQNWTFPIIAKPVHGSKGDGIFKHATLQDALDQYAHIDKPYLHQEYIVIDSDIRVFIVGEKILGAMKRYVVPGDFRSNAALGAQTESIPVTPELASIALEAKHMMGYDVVGVDVIESDGKLMILEVNNTPEWQAFKKTTGINPAPEIIKYAVEKYERAQSAQ